MPYVRDPIIVILVNLFNLFSSVNLYIINFLEKNRHGSCKWLARVMKNETMLKCHMTVVPLLSFSLIKLKILKNADAWWIRSNPRFGMIPRVLPREHSEWKRAEFAGKWKSFWQTRKSWIAQHFLRFLFFLRENANYEKQGSAVLKKDQYRIKRKKPYYYLITKNYFQTTMDDVKTKSSTKIAYPHDNLYCIQELYNSTMKWAGSMKKRTLNFLPLVFLFFYNFNIPYIIYHTI